jgi:hypothetical protein
MEPSNAHTRNVPSRRRTPTEKQIEALGWLDDNALVEKAIEAMHALNRRAKEIRDRKNVYRRATFARALAHDMEDIYALKDRLLEALVLAARATVGRFEVQVVSNERVCSGCGHSWFGGPRCYACDEDSGVALESTRTWYIIDCGNGYRFHQPQASAAVAAKAAQVRPHDPTQPQREIPKIGLTIQAQRRCVEMATSRLRVSTELCTPSDQTPSTPAENCVHAPDIEGMEAQP